MPEIERRDLAKKYGGILAYGAKVGGASPAEVQGALALARRLEPFPRIWALFEAGKVGRGSILRVPLDLLGEAPDAWAEHLVNLGRREIQMMVRAERERRAGRVPGSAHASRALAAGLGGAGSGDPARVLGGSGDPSGGLGKGSRSGCGEEPGSTFDGNTREGSGDRPREGPAEGMWDVSGADSTDLAPGTVAVIATTTIDPAKSPGDQLPGQGFLPGIAGAPMDAEGSAALTGHAGDALGEPISPPEERVEAPTHDFTLRLDDAQYARLLVAQRARSRELGRPVSLSELLLGFVLEGCVDASPAAQAQLDHGELASLRERAVAAAETATRKVAPRAVQREAEARSGGTCQRGLCLLAGEHLHHLIKWKARRSDLPYRLRELPRHHPDAVVWLCSTCHDLLHEGRIENAQDRPEKWTLLPAGAPGNPDAHDRLFQEHRRAARGRYESSRDASGFDAHPRGGADEVNGFLASRGGATQEASGREGPRRSATEEAIEPEGSRRGATEEAIEPEGPGRHATEEASELEGPGRHATEEASEPEGSRRGATEKASGLAGFRRQAAEMSSVSGRPGRRGSRASSEISGATPLEMERAP